MPRRSLFLLAVLMLALIGCSRAAPEADPGDRSPTTALNVSIAPVPTAVGTQLPGAPVPHESPAGDLTDEDIEADAVIARIAGVRRFSGEIVHEYPDLDARVEAALPEIDRLNTVALAAAVGADNLGLPNDAVKLPWFLTAAGADAPPRSDDEPPAKGLTNAFTGRSGTTKPKLIKHYGGNEESERAVEVGLAWLAKQQKKDGSWAFDQGVKDKTVAATGLALLPFLAAGQTHTDKNAKYRDVVKNGLDWLVKNRTAVKGGPDLIGGNDMYEQAIATLALCEAYGMTKDKDLRKVAQAAINDLQRAQGPNGSWGYSPNANGDTSIVGWHVQALFVAKQSGDLIVDDRAIKKAIKFLDSAAGGMKKSMYGYNDNAGAAPGTALTAVGLWSRAAIDNWTAEHPGMTDGLTGLIKNGPANKGGVRNLYYLYYATQVVRNSGGEDWATWNEGPKGGDGTRKGGLRDWIVGQQVRKEGGNLGSWDPEAGWFGSSCGRVGTTAICLLNLEVYYRYTPVEKKDEPKEKEPEKK